MTRARKIGYSHAALSTAWFSAMALDSSQIINGLLGDAGCLAISWGFGMPLSWIVALLIGIPAFPTLPAHIFRMSIFGAVIIVNGLIVGHFINRLLCQAERSDSSRRRRMNKQNKAEMATPRKPSD